MDLSGLSCGDFMRQKWRLYESNDNLPRGSKAGTHVEPRRRDVSVDFLDHQATALWVKVCEV